MGLRGKAIATEVVSPIRCVDSAAGTRVANELCWTSCAAAWSNPSSSNVRAASPTSRHLPSGRLVEMRMSTHTARVKHRQSPPARCQSQSSNPFLSLSSYSGGVSPGWSGPPSLSSRTSSIGDGNFARRTLLNHIDRDGFDGRGPRRLRWSRSSAGGLLRCCTFGPNLGDRLGFPPLHRFALRGRGTLTRLNAEF